jgi:hypothetical protein
MSAWHIADVPLELMNVRFEGNNGHCAGLSLCPLMTQSGHLGHTLFEWQLCLARTRSVRRLREAERPHW